MRELVFKNITSQDKKRKSLFISETVFENGIQTTTQRRSIYIIARHSTYKNQAEFNNFVAHSPQSIENNSQRHVFIFKKRDSKSKKDTFICDVVGRFYIVANEDIYTIAFKHSFEVDFIANSMMLPE